MARNPQLKKRRQLKKQRRAKKIRKYKNKERALAKRKKFIQTVSKNLQPMPKPKGFRVMVYTIFRDLMLLLGKIECKVGIHNWKLCSGRQGDPKFVCLRCWKRSKRLWGEGGSSGHYEIRGEKNEPKKEK